MDDALTVRLLLESTLCGADAEQRINGFACLCSPNFDDTVNLVSCTRQRTEVKVLEFLTIRTCISYERNLHSAVVGLRCRRYEGRIGNCEKAGCRIRGLRQPEDIPSGREIVNRDIFDQVVATLVYQRRERNAIEHAVGRDKNQILALHRFADRRPQI